jgi:hypothetical protein
MKLGVINILWLTYYGRLTETVFFVAMGNKWLFGKKRNVSQKMLN